jgi:alpha-ketoglutarate-dependent taurine dioxygenase
MRIKPLSDHGALVIEPTHEVRLTDLDRNQVIESFRSAGMLLFRGFGADDAEFHSFGRTFTTRFLVDPTPTRVSQPLAAELQTVTTGNDALNLHFEYGITPFRPDILFLLCSRPADRGGQTLVCDGTRIWERLQRSTQNLLLTRRVKYKLDLEPAIWGAFFGLDPTHPSSAQQLQERLQGFDGLEYHLHPGTRTLSLQYSALAAGRTRYNAADSFIGSVLPGVYRGVEEARFADGSALPQAILSDITHAMTPVLIELNWNSGEVAMIDNSRWLHGRRSFSDRRRRVLTLSAYSEI